jgi:hypothetical protein
MSRLTMSRGRIVRTSDGALRRDDGAGLVELIIVMGLTMILGTMIVMTFIQGTQAVYVSDARGADTAQAKLATENLSKQLRLAIDPDGAGMLTAFTTATPYDVTFYAASGNRTSTVGVVEPAQKVRIWLSEDGVLHQQVIAPVVTGGVTSWPGSGSTRTVGVDVVPGSLPLFTYLAVSDQTPGDNGVTETTLENTGGAVTDEALTTIQAVEVWVAVKSSGSRRSSPTTAVTRVTLLNR